MTGELEVIRSFAIKNRYKILAAMAVFLWMLLGLILMYKVELYWLIQRDENGEITRFGFIKPFYFLIGISMLILFWGVIVLAKRVRIEIVFVIAIMVIGVIYMFILPPYSCPDEARHINTTFYYTNQLLQETATDAQGNTLLRPCDNDYNHSNNIPTIESYERLVQGLTSTSTETPSEVMENAVGYPLSVPFFGYLPQILGTALARLLRLGGVPTLLVGRFFSLLFYSLCIGLAIRTTPIGKEILMILGLTPMGVEIATSFTYDATVIPVSFLFFAYVMFLTLQKESVTWKDWGILTLCMMYLAPIKVVYVLLAGLCILIPIKKHSHKYTKYIGIGTVFTGGTIMLLLERLSQISTMVGIAATDKGYFSLEYIVHNPLMFVKVMYGTFYYFFGYYIETAVGGRLGWLEIYISQAYVFAFIVLLVLACITKKNEKYSLFAIQKLVLLMVSGVVIMAIIFALMCDLTPITAFAALGVQGRYFIPILPLLLICFKNKMITTENNISRYLIVATCTVQYFVILQVFVVIAQRTA